MSVCVCVCVCVYERERERKRERGGGEEGEWDMSTYLFRLVWFGSMAYQPLQVI